MPSPSNVELTGGVRVYKVAAALVAFSSNQFKSQPLLMRAWLAAIRDAYEVLALLLGGGHTYVAGWLAGAFRDVGKRRAIEMDQFLFVDPPMCHRIALQSAS